MARVSVDVSKSSERLNQQCRNIEQVYTTIGGMEIRTSGDIYDQETETEHKSVAITFFKPVLTLRYAINKH